MNSKASCAREISVVLAIVTTLGCVGPSEVRRFKPVPIAQTASRDLGPVEPRPVTELLGAAQQAFRTGNAAQEKGDHESALLHYTQMLELLIEADLDPAVFYDLRGEFEQILDKTSQRSTRFKREPSPEWPGEPDVDRHVAGDLAIPFPLPERVLKEIDRAHTLYPKHFQAGLERSYKYAPYIRREFAKAGLPQDLVWLAMVESQFYPRAISPAGASGMWQFMRGTANRYNLRVDYYVDERFNWEKATQAAIAYLSDLHALFDGNWPLAIAAYNMGEGGLERAIALNGGERNFWKLVETPPASYHIRLETKRFYPKLLATILMAQNPERYGFKIEAQSPDEVERVPMKGYYSLAALDKASGLPHGTLQKLNPDLIRGLTPPSVEYLIAVPKDAQAKFEVAMKNVPELRGTMYASGEGGTAIHVVRQGETLSGIAQRYRVSLRDLMGINRIRSPKRLQVGKKLVVPVRPGYREYGSREGRRTYNVRRGDTLSEIAKRERVTVSQLQAWNAKGKSTHIRAGQALYVSPPGAASAPVPSGEKRVHVVAAGEYPAKIAKRYSVPLDDFLDWNNLTTRSLIRVGDKLAVYGPGAGPTLSDAASGRKQEKGSQVGVSQPHGTEEVIHRVKKDENPWLIAKRYGVRTSDFLAWNGLASKSVIHSGEQYVVYVPNKHPAEKQPEQEVSPGSQPAEGRKIVHTVRRGQNPSTIAQRYGVKLSDVFKWNAWKQPPVLQIGSKVIIFKE